MEPPEVEVKVLYFAAAREAVGLREEPLRVRGAREGQAPTLADLRRALERRHPRAAEAIAGVALALNLEYAEDEDGARLREGDEVALIPPISGG